MPKQTRTGQQEFELEGFEKPGDQFGGGLLKGNPKKKRPLDSKLPIHLTLRANKSVLRLPKLYGRVQRTIREVAKKHGVRIYKVANVGNHLHAAIKIRHVDGWAAFIRELTGRLGLICRHVSGEDGLWKYRPHTRIFRSWHKTFKNLLKYIELNQWEAEGRINRKETSTLKDMRLIFRSG